MELTLILTNRAKPSYFHIIMNYKNIINNLIILNHYSKRVIDIEIKNINHLEYIKKYDEHFYKNLVELDSYSKYESLENTVKSYLYGIKEKAIKKLITCGQLQVVSCHTFSMGGISKSYASKNAKIIDDKIIGEFHGKPTKCWGAMNKIDYKGELNSSLERESGGYYKIKGGFSYSLIEVIKFLKTDISPKKTKKNLAIAKRKNWL